MDKTIPSAAAYILDFISKPESKGNYNVYNGFKQARLPKKLTNMTLAEVLRINWRAIGAYSSAAGRYQIIKDTLQGLITDLNLPLNTKFTADLQDRLGYHLLRRRGYDAWVDKRITTQEFAKRLAQEWASLPVLEETKNYKGVLIQKGTSYYAGDGLNSHGVSADAFAEALEYAFHFEDRYSIAATEKKTSKTTGSMLAAAGAATGAAGAVVGSSPNNLPDMSTVTTVAMYAKDAWVIGPVFGCIVLAAVVVGGFIWWRSRK